MVVGGYVHSASDAVLYEANSTGSLSTLWVGINATVFNSGASSPYLLLSAG